MGSGGGGGYDGAVSAHNTGTHRHTDRQRDGHVCVSVCIYPTLNKTSHQDTILFALDLVERKDFKDNNTWNISFTFWVEVKCTIITTPVPIPPSSMTFHLDT